MEKLPPSAAAPTTAKAMAELGAGLTVGDLLAGTVRGDAMPTELADMVRYIASRREAAAEVVDLGRLALMPENAELRPFVRVIGEYGRVLRGDARTHGVPRTAPRDRNGSARFVDVARSRLPRPECVPGDERGGHGRRRLPPTRGRCYGSCQG